MGYLGQLHSFTGPRTQDPGPRTQDTGRRSTGLQVQGKLSYCIAAEYYKETLTNRSRGMFGDRVLPCHVSLTPKKILIFAVDNLFLART